MTTTAIRVPLCTLGDIAVGLGRAFTVGERSLAVFRGRDGRVFAVDGRFLVLWQGAGVQAGSAPVTVPAKGVAIRLAAEVCRAGTPPAGLCACSTFSSLEDAAAWHFPWLPTRWLLLDRFPSAERVTQVTCPILLLHGRRDTTVPYDLGRKLFEACPAESADGIPKRLVDLPQADHNDILYTEAPVLRRAIQEFVREVTRPAE